MPPAQSSGVRSASHSNFQDGAAVGGDLGAFAGGPFGGNEIHRGHDFGDADFFPAAVANHDFMGNSGNQHQSARGGAEGRLDRTLHRNRLAVTGLAVDQFQA